MPLIPVTFINTYFKNIIYSIRIAVQHMLFTHFISIGMAGRAAVCIQRLRAQTTAGWLAVQLKGHSESRNREEMASYSVQQHGISAKQENAYKMGENSGSV